MPFDPVDPHQSFPALEHGILAYWRTEDTFKRSVKQRASTPPLRGGVYPERSRGAQHDTTFSFYDGPPFATGFPHYGHLLGGTIKDVIPRYQTMRGHQVQRRFGWDCHGLPVENLVEQENGIRSKREIEEKGVAWFNDLCRKSVLRYTAEWRRTVERTGRWVDMDWDYRTMDPDYMESIWWVFQELYRKKLIYEGQKSMHVCPRCVTPLSNFEVTLGYKDVADWTTTTMYPLVDDPKTVLLAWTTTSWTLPGNLFLAIGPKIAYAKVQVAGDSRTYIVAETLVASVFQGKEYNIVGTLTAKHLLGRHYEPLFPYFAAEYKKQKAFRIVAGDFVTTEDGTGIVHIATGFGTDDYEVGKREGVETLSHVGMDGRFIAAVTDFAGEEVKPPDDPTKTDKKIGAYLKEKGKLFAQGSFTHSYPHCWRCDSPLINYSTSSWFVKVEKIKKDLLKANAKTEWVPEHIRDGRFGEWLKNARDWAISRNRYWGTPLPIWRCEETGEIEVIGSREELMTKCPSRFTKVTILRHGQSAGNVHTIYQGAMPGTALTEEGRAQALSTAKLLATEKGIAKVAAIYHSPLTRTLETATVLAKKVKTQLHSDERLREVQFGVYEGKHVDFSDLAFVQARREHRLKTGQVESIYHLPGMETWEQVDVRCQAFLRDVLPRHRGEHIVIVTHADPVNVFRQIFTGEDPHKIAHQPYPAFAAPHTFFFDHETGKQLDLHRETVDSLTWKGKKGGALRRIPEVLDCWFESGSMPYAQAHFPFEMGGSVGAQRAVPLRQPEGFPADFIAEGLDQTRGWFYTLMVLSTALFKKPAFRHCVVNGIVLAEDGRKMSKRLKNYPEPDAIMEKYGADAMRFALMASPAVRGEDLRFSERAVEETVRRVLLPLWNAYSFFVTYANEAGWEPGSEERERVMPSSAAAPSIRTSATASPRATRGDTAARIEAHGPAGAALHPLDRWIRAETQDLVNRMTEQLDQYDLSATCAELHETIDHLTDWYVRRSRRRFAGKEHPSTPLRMTEEERMSGLQTLYDVLLTLSKLLAPFCPFLTEHLYLNLAGDDHGSVHLTDWPAVRELTKEERALITKTRLLRTIVSLGMKLRAEAKIKVRQPLHLLQVAVPPRTPKLTAEDAAILEEELHVKRVHFLADPSAFADRFVQVDARKVGPRLGAKVQEVIRAAKAGAFTERADGGITVLGEKLSSEEAEVVYRGKEGHVVASERGIVASLDTAMTEDLKLEGLARDVIRAVQVLRKERGLAVADRIALEAGQGLETLLQVHRSLIEAETNGVFDAPEGKLRVRVGVGEMGEVLAENA